MYTPLNFATITSSKTTSYRLNLRMASTHEIKEIKESPVKLPNLAEDCVPNCNVTAIGYLYSILKFLLQNNLIVKRVKTEPYNEAIISYINEIYLRRKQQRMRPTFTSRLDFTIAICFENGINPLSYVWRYKHLNISDDALNTHIDFLLKQNSKVPK